MPLIIIEMGPRPKSCRNSQRPQLLPSKVFASIKHVTVQNPLWLTYSIGHVALAAITGTTVLVPYLYRETSNISRNLSCQWTCLSLRCSWSIACRHCSNYIFILDLTPDFNGLGKNNCKTRRGTFRFGDFVCLILEDLQQVQLLPLISSLGDCRFHWLVPDHESSSYDLTNEWAPV